MLVEQSVHVEGSKPDVARDILSPAAMNFLSKLQGEFGAKRRMLLKRRMERQSAIDAGDQPDFPSATAWMRQENWLIAPVPADLQNRRVEITGPTDRKMMINALNSGASVFMADFEDANSPAWANMAQGQANLRDAIAGTLAFTAPDGRVYRLHERTARLMVRPRGWHLEETHVQFERQPMAASLVDFGLFLFHNAHALLAKGTGPYFYLPKLENHLEARLWSEVFDFAEQELSLPHGSIRATVLIENILAAFEMEEILYELQDHIVGLNAGRWDYIFSIIRKFRSRPDVLLPDRAQITMTVPFMRAYTELLVKTCHRRGAHAIGGMAAFIPSRKDPVVNETALQKVREDKQREASDGFDGTWVAHPDLVPVAMDVFNAALGDKPHQRDCRRLDVNVTADDLLNFSVPDGRITEAGVRTNVRVALEYLAAWFGGNGAVAINNLMEDAATAEISRAQIWQWLHHHGVALQDGRPMSRQLYQQIMLEELASLSVARAPGSPEARRLDAAAQLFDRLALDDEFTEFLTASAYAQLDQLAGIHE